MPSRASSAAPGPVSHYAGVTPPPEQAPNTLRRAIASRHTRACDVARAARSPFAHCSSEPAACRRPGKQAKAIVLRHDARDRASLRLVVSDGTACAPRGVEAVAVGDVWV